MSNQPKTDLARLLEAAAFAADRHRHQRRKDVDATPYINHPLEVARTLTEAGVNDVEVLIAAVLHDTVEDTETTYEDVLRAFGQRVASLVMEVTDDKSLAKAERKRLQVLNAPKKSDGAKMIKIADKIANLRDIQNSPPNWTDNRIAAYVTFAEDVGTGCSGVNIELDRMLVEQVQSFE